MQSIDNTAARDYCSAGKNVLDAAVGFVHNTGSGYTSAPTVSFSGGGGTGAAATALIANGQVIGFTITNGGTGYTSAPTVAFSGGGGSGAAATAVLTGGAVSAINVTNGGTGGTLTVTDNTSYASGDSRKVVNIDVYDYFGGKVSGTIPSGGGGSVVINLGGLNNSRGFAMSVMVVSTKGMVKDGSQFKISNTLTSGNFVMEK